MDSADYKLMSKVGIGKVGPFTFQCAECGAKWTPQLREGPSLPRDWWKCPAGCNHPSDRDRPR